MQNNRCGPGLAEACGISWNNRHEDQMMAAMVMVSSRGVGAGWVPEVA